MGIFHRIRSLGRRSELDREIAAELQAHIAMRTEDNIAAGMEPHAAERDARLRFGNPAVMKERVTQMDSALLLSSLWADTRYAARQFVKHPGFAITAIVMLALGICASIAIFAFVDATLVKPLPYLQPNRLVALYETTSLGPRFHLSYLDYIDWKKMNSVFRSLDAYDTNGVQLSTATGIEQVEGAIVSDGFFRTLGVSPILGRDFHAGEDTAGAARTVLLSYATWQRRFGGRADVLGQTVTLDGASNTVIGVLPRAFHFVPAEPAEFWMTLHKSAQEDRGDHGLSAIARLKDGVPLSTATAEIQTIASQLAKQYPDSDGGRGATVLPLSEVIVGNLKPILLVLLSGAALLLLIACVNVASLLLVRSENRKREFALREALGASSSRLVAQFITEGMILVAIGSVLGLASASVLIKMMIRLIPADMLAGMPYFKEVGLNAEVMLVACLISVAMTALFSMIPMLRLPVHSLRSSLSEGGRGFAANTWRRLGANLVVLELATAVILLVGAGLLCKSFYRLLHTDIGMQPDHLATLRVVLHPSGHSADGKTVTDVREIQSRVAALPGVVSVAITRALPVGSGAGSTTFGVVGRSKQNPQTDIAALRNVGPEYFTTLKTRLLRGRYFRKDEDATKPSVMVINQTMSKQVFPLDDALGKRIVYDDTKPPIEIVGIVDDIKEGPLDGVTRPMMYIPFDQEPSFSFYLLVRTSPSEESVLPAMTAAVHALHPDATTSQGESMEHRISDSYAAYLHRASAWLVGGFASIALILGVVGIYGVTAYSVSQRTREIGVRMALGAQRSSIAQMVLREAGWLTIAGIGGGLVCSMGTAMLMRKLLFSTAVWDAPTLCGVAVVLGASAMLASYIPARRAASVNPVEALRAE